MIRRLIGWCLSRLPNSDIGDGADDVFLRRYTLFKCRRFQVHLHQFFRSDKTRCLHDHPWPFTTIILRGGYWEWIPDKWVGDPPSSGFAPTPITTIVRVRRVWRPAGYIGRYPAQHAHRIAVNPKRLPWSLVIVGRKVRPWGFWGPHGWTVWRDSHRNPVCEYEETS